MSGLKGSGSAGMPSSLSGLGFGDAGFAIDQRLFAGGVERAGAGRKVAADIFGLGFQLALRRQQGAWRRPRLPLAGTAGAMAALVTLLLSQKGQAIRPRSRWLS